MTQLQMRWTVALRADILEKILEDVSEMYVGATLGKVPQA